MAIPSKIQLNKSDGWLKIVWQDGTNCRYPLAHLREACPCVQCRGGHGNMGTEQEPEDLLTLTLTPSRSHEIVELLPVGNYALQPRWSDGHDTGIYTWEFLRRMCPDERKMGET